LDIGNEIGLEEVAKYIPMYMDILNSVYSEEYAIRFAKRFLSKNNDININYLVLIKLKIIVLSVNLEKYEKIEQIEELLEYDIEEKYRSECYYTLLNLENNKNKLEYYRNKLIKYYKKREEAKYQVRLNKIK